MKTREVLLILIAAAFAGVAIVTWSGAEEANERAVNIRKEADAARTRSETEIKALGERIAKEAAAARKSADEAATTAAARITEAASARTKAEADAAKAKEDAGKAKEDAGKAALKAAELEKSKAAADQRVNELNAELARLRDGSELKEALARQKKAESDLEVASGALRDANAKAALAAAAAAARIAELEEENRRLREQSKGATNVSPNYRAL